MQSVSRLAALVFVLAIGGSGVARADQKVDWSQYLEPAGSKPPPIKHESVAAAPAAKPAAKAARPAPAKRAAPAAAKAKRRPAARPHK